jgi:ABC-type transporter MlaC component
MLMSITLLDSRALLRLALASIALALGLGQAAVASEVTTPVEQLHAGLMAIMKAGKTAPFRQRYDMIAPVIGRTFDLEVILQQVIGPRLAALPPDQRAAVGDAFRRYTIASYVANFDTYSGQRFEVAPVVRAAGSDRVVETQIAAASGQGMFWTMSCGRRVADGRWWTYWWTAPSAGWRLNDPKCAPCWPTAAAPGCSSACRKPLTCPAVFCSSVAGGKTAGRGRRLERSLGNAQSPMKS